MYFMSLMYKKQMEHKLAIEEKLESAKQSLTENLAGKKYETQVCIKSNHSVYF